MTTPELLQFIRIEHALGMSFNEIIQLLTTEGGWDKGDVSEAFSTLGLPEEAIELFFAKDKKVETKSVPAVQVALNKPKIVEEKVKEPLSISTPPPPQVKTYLGQATPMHYVEEPEKIKKPTLARPASLSGQASRPLVRTLSNAISYAKVDKSKIGGPEGPVLSVSKIEGGHGLARDVAELYPSGVKTLSREIETVEKISEIEKSLSFGIDLAKEEPKPKKIVSPAPITTEVDLSNIKPIKISEGGEIEETDKVKAEVLRPNIPPVQKEEVSNIYRPQSLTPLQSRTQSIETKVIEKEIAPSIFNKGILPGIELETPPPPPLHEKAPDNLGIKSETPVSLKEEPAIIPKTEIAKPTPISQISHVPEVLEKKVEKIEPSIIKIAEPVIIPKTEIVKPNPIPEISHIPKVEERIAKKIVAPKITKEEPVVTINAEVSEAKPTFDINIPPKIEASVIEKNIAPVPPSNIEKQKEEDASRAMQAEVAKAVQAEVARAVQTEVAKAAQSPTTPSSPFFTPPQPQYIQQPPQIIVMPPTMHAQQLPGQYFEQPNTPPPKTMIGENPRVTEISSSSPELEEQAYLAQFGQAKMPEGLVRPSPSMVAPTIIYASQMPPSQPVQKEKVEEKKPDPIRFDIGRLRTAHRADRLAFSKRPNTAPSLSQLSPETPKTVEELFTSPENKKDLVGLGSNLEKESSKSMKIPLRRTMESDLLSVQGGAIPTQNALQSLSDVSSELILSEEPIVPPPPKKSSKSLLIISIISIAIIAFASAVAYYLIVLRLPSGSEVYENAVGVALRGPAMTYNANFTVHAKSTDAEPEYIDVDFNASGTLSIRERGFEDGIHEIKTKISHMGVPMPISFDFDGKVSVDEDYIFVSQNSPSSGTKIENILKSNEILKLSYRDIGKILNLSTEAIINGGDYGSISEDISLFKLATKDSPIITYGELIKFKKDNKEYYKIPIKLDAKKAVKGGDMLSKYFRGGEAITTGAERASVLEDRYNVINGEIIVEKLSMKPISLSLYGKFDPSKIPLDGELKLLINFSFSQQLPIVDTNAETYEEIVQRRATESVSSEIIKKDAPYVSIISVLNLALNQYYEKIGRFPIALNDLATAGFVDKETLKPPLTNNIYYSSYVAKPSDLVSGVRCQAKNTKCNFYHLGTNLEYRNEPLLQSDADVITADISGDDNTGCRKESGFACYDILLEK